MLPNVAAVCGPPEEVVASVALEVTVMARLVRRASNC
jgi:hypothetical protein